MIIVNKHNQNLQQMSKYTKTFLGVISFFVCTHLFSQEQLGLRLGNYSGISGVRLNPTSGVNSPMGWDINIASMGYSFANDFAFIKDASVQSFLRNLLTLGPAPETKIEVPWQPTQFFDFFNQPHEKFVSSFLFIGLPSYQINLESGHTLGFYVEQRGAFTTRQIPIDADPYQQKEPLNVRYNIPSMNVTSMAWQEYGFNYAYQIGGGENGGLSVGFNAKVLRANQGIFVKSSGGSAITKLTKDSVRVDALNATIGYTTNYLEHPLHNNGFGFGFDLGAQLVVGTGDFDNRPYLFRAGASLIDIGKANFNYFTDVHAIKLTESVDFHIKDYYDLNPKDPYGDAIRRFNKQKSSRVDSSIQSHRFSLALPTALSLQGDIAMTENFFINGLLIQRIQLTELAISRDNLLAITPRFESRWFDASLPVSVLNYRQVRVGLTARLAFLTLGTDHLMSFIGQKRLSGSDFYVALKMNAFTLGKLGHNGSFGGGLRGGKNVKCYRF